MEDAVQAVSKQPMGVRMHFPRNNQGEVAWGLREGYGVVLAIHPDD